MRFMILVKAAHDSEAGTMPGAAVLSAMESLHAEMAKAGVLLDAAGCTLIDVRSHEEALEWARRFPRAALEAGTAQIEVHRTGGDPC